MNLPNESPCPKNSSQFIYIPILVTLLMPVFNLSSTDNDVSVERSGIKWKTQSKANNFVSLKGGSLTINQDGCYFLYLQVTLETPEVSGQHIVRVNKPNQVLLEVRMTNTSLSTGFLGRAVDLAASDTLTVTVSPGARINTTYTATYLGIISPTLYL
uniref:THD domain-containing protein n=1 Tax=Oncorhynchus mykiss TaxID=8022 RepID=A0A8K9Y4B5_ONCMY